MHRAILWVILHKIVVNFYVGFFSIVVICIDNSKWLGKDFLCCQYGMSGSELKILGETLDPAFGEAVSAIDQTGASRTGKTVIGAVVK